MYFNNAMTKFMVINRIDPWKTVTSLPDTLSSAAHPWEAEDRMSENAVEETNKKSEVVLIRTMDKW